MVLTSRRPSVEAFYDTLSVKTNIPVETTFQSDLDAARAFVTEEWEGEASEVERGFERIESSVVGTGLDDWS